MQMFVITILEVNFAFLISGDWMWTKLVFVVIQEWYLFVNGRNIIVCTLESGKMMVWGDNKHGQLLRDPSQLTLSDLPLLAPSAGFDGRQVEHLYSGWTHMLAKCSKDSNCLTYTPEYTSGNKMYRFLVVLQAVSKIGLWLQNLSHYIRVLLSCLYLKYVHNLLYLLSKYVTWTELCCNNIFLVELFKLWKIENVPAKDIFMLKPESLVVWRSWNPARFLTVVVFLHGSLSKWSTLQCRQHVTVWIALYISLS